MYFYIINYNFNEEQLCKLEMKYLFDLIPKRKYFLSEKYVDVNRSPFIKASLQIIAKAQSIEKLISIIIEKKISYKNFKIKYINIEGKMDFELKHKIEDAIGNAIFGDAKIHDPDIILGIIYYEDYWILGEYNKNEGIWDIHNKKPCYYCNALPTRISRAVVNIAVGNDMTLKLVDPCCGIGTVVIEALSMGLNIEGYDINPKVIEGARRNLRYFGYDDVLEVSDIKDIRKQYDVSIIDIPYGVLSITSELEQISILKNARRISSKMVLISLNQMDREIKDSGFTVIDRCEIIKRDFKRYVTVCI
ncbi:methyltransferase domain-containing protein [Caloramator sp. E03]|uniref:TRM11 family SAM-dependent methyltransferase n=1 Tax=Caloramator sp. E03 TaxID=2576307 RepID=UPI001110845B|nr:methyltransferase domain-containing protein [Caloramator sp. E03]QCX34636.1 methyltransferase domain-containing protein [Caloramator sp. E03]